MADYFENKCEVVRDLLPIYADHGTSAETSKLIAEHLEACPACRDYLRHIKSYHLRNRDFSDVVGIPDYRGFLKRLRRRRMAETVLFAALIGSIAANVALLCLADTASATEDK